jgi:anti-sigma factor RsiW
MISINATSPAENPPRFTCRVVRQWCAISGHQRLRHIAACTSCQAYFAASQSWEDALRRDATDVIAETLTTSAALEQNILRAVRLSAMRPENSRRFFPGRTWAVGALGAIAAAMAVVAAFVTLNPGSTPGMQPRLAEASTAEEAAVIIDTVETLSSELVESVIPSASQMVSKNPLQQELGMVYSDMRSALDFLKLNFLPSVPTNSEPVRAQRI